MQRVAKKVARLTENAYGARVVPRSGMLRALNVVRHIRYLQPSGGATPAGYVPFSPVTSKRFSSPDRSRLSHRWIGYR